MTTSFLLYLCFHFLVRPFPVCLPFPMSKFPARFFCLSRFEFGAEAGSLPAADSTTTHPPLTRRRTTEKRADQPPTTVVPAPCTCTPAVPSVPRRRHVRRQAQWHSREGQRRARDTDTQYQRTGWARQQQENGTRLELCTFGADGPSKRTRAHSSLFIRLRSRAALTHPTPLPRCRCRLTSTRSRLASLVCATT